MKKNVSMVIPAYNAGDYIEKNIQKLSEVLKDQYGTYEIIVVVDGLTSKKDKTKENALRAAKIYKKSVKVFALPANKGKGFAVRYGFSKAHGEIIGFIDAGDDIEYSSLKSLFNVLKHSGAHAVVGSKSHPLSKINYSKKRKLFSLFYQQFVKILFRLPVKDTQAGIKIFKAISVKNVLRKLKVDGFAFDIELLVLIQEYGYKIAEAPIRVKFSPPESSTIKDKGGLTKVSLHVFKDTLKVFYDLKIKHKYNISINRSV